MRIKVAAEEQDLKENQTRRPNGRCSAKPRKQKLRKDELNLKQQECAAEYREAKSEASAHFQAGNVRTMSLLCFDSLIARISPSLSTVGKPEAMRARSGDVAVPATDGYNRIKSASDRNLFVSAVRG